MAKLKKYRVTGEVAISVTCLVMARDEAHALQLAEDVETGTGFCHSCSADCDPEDTDPEWRASELDGTPKNFTAEEEDG